MPGKYARSVKAVVVALLLALSSMLLLAGPASAEPSAAAANDRTKTYIALGAGKQSINAGDGKFDLSEAELQFLGIFMSNFYVPFSTELGPAGTTESQEDGKKAMSDILMSVLNMDQATADTVGNVVFSRIAADSKKLMLGVAEKPEATGSAIKTLPDEASLYSLMQLISGAATGDLHNKNNNRSVLLPHSERVENADDDAVLGAMDGTYKYGFLYYLSGDTKVPVFNFDLSGQTTTPSVQALEAAYAMVQPTQGFGFNLLDFTNEEMSADPEAFQDFIDAAGTESALKSTIFGSELYVSPFGDISVVGAVHKLIMLPGAMNPYTWQSVDSTGSKEGYPGQAIMAINLPMISMMESGSLISSFDPVEKIATLNDPTVTNREQLESEHTAQGEGMEGSENQYNLSNFRGTQDSALPTSDSGWWIFSSERSNTFDQFIKDQMVAMMDKQSTPGVLQFNRTLAEDTTLGLQRFNMSFFGVRDQTQRGLTWGQQVGGIFGAMAPVKFNQNMVFIDELGTYGWGSSTESTYETATFLPYLGGEGVLETKNVDEAAFAPNAFESSALQKNYMRTSHTWEGVNEQLIVGVYLTYVYAMFETGENAGQLGYKVNVSGLPTISDKPVEVSEEIKADYQLTAIRDWVYYLLHPTEGIDYVTTLLTNKVSGFFLGWHSDMVGTEGTGILPGSTKYLGMSGYVTTPEFSDVQWLDTIVTLYSDNVVYLMLFFVVIMATYAISGMLSWQRAIVGAVIFGVGAVIPVNAISWAVTTSNSFSDRIYGEKFTFWALMQHQSFTAALDEASTSDTYENYLRKRYSERSAAASNAGGDSIVVKWQAPKKMASLMLTGDVQDVMGENVQRMAGGLIEATYSGEDYLNDTDAVYLYRTYTDIGNFSRFIYGGISGEGGNPNFPQTRGDLSSSIVNSWSEDLRTSWAARDLNYSDDRGAGYTNMNADGSSNFNNQIRTSIPLSSKIVSDAFTQAGTMKDLQLGEYVGLSSDYFGFSIPMFSGGQGQFIQKMTSTSTFPDPSMGGQYTDKDYTGLAGYALMSENSYYYFSWLLYDQGLSTSNGAQDGYKNMMLGGANGGFFYNVNDEGTTNGELKDFLDMKSLFTYVIPYLKQGNNLVQEWDDLYGIKLYDGVPYEEGREGDVAGNPELEQKYWHNVNVARLYYMYAPWVDLMYSASYAQPEKVQVLGEFVTIEDPLDPASYPDERPMIFSKSEMVDFGLVEGQLTQVERKIISVQEDSQKDLLNLMNYYTFNDNVLNTAAGINIAFNFNSEFSQANFFGESSNIYPKAYELRSFSFDAFLRLILSNNSGQGIAENYDKDFYTMMTQETSLLTALLLIVNDVVAVYLIPALKVFFLVALLITSILMLIAGAVKVIETKILKSLFSSLVRPLLGFLGITIAQAWLVSLLMGNGHTGVTGDPGFTINFGNPTMALFALLVINAAVLFLFFKICMGIWKDMKSYTKSVGTSIAAALSGSLAAGVRTATGGRVDPSFGGGGGSGSASAAAASGRDNRGVAANLPQGAGQPQVSVMRGRFEEPTERQRNKSSQRRGSTATRSRSGGSKDQFSRRDKNFIKNVMAQGKDKTSSGRRTRTRSIPRPKK